MLYWCPWVLNINQFHSIINCFHLTMFYTSEPNDPQMTWILKGQRYPNMCFTFIPDIQISVHFAARWTVLKLWVTFETSVRNDPKWSWTLQSQRHPMYVLLVSPRPKVHFVFSPSRHIRVKCYFKTSVENDLKVTLNTQRYPIYVLVVSVRHKFQSVSVYNQTLLTYMAFKLSPIQPLVAFCPKSAKLKKSTHHFDENH